MKTAFPFWNNRIAPVFDVARQLLVVEISAGRVIRETEEDLPADDLAAKVECLARLGVNTLVCGAISRPMQGLVSSRGITLVPFVAGELQEVIRAWLTGRLHDDNFAMPGCCSQVRQKGGSCRGRGETGGASGTCGFCVCPQCGRMEPHQRGIPCSRIQCPACGSPLVRGKGPGQEREDRIP